jgi:hypothetical protein
MCDKCSELDKKIEHLETLAQRVLDQMTTDGIAELVRELRDEKKKLHPDQEWRRTAMAESFGSEFTIVEVTADDFARPYKQIWVAAAKPDQAITLVLTAVPEGWTAELATGRLTRQQLGALKRLCLKPGEVREL